MKTFAGGESRSIISFTDAADFTGARFQARSTAPPDPYYIGNILHWPCTDADQNGLCDNGCTNPPLGFNPTAASPRFLIYP